MTATGERSDPFARLAWIAFAILIVLSPLAAHVSVVERGIPTVSAYYTTVAVSWAELVAIVVLGLWIASRVARPRPLAVEPRVVAIPAAILLATAWLGVAMSIEPALALGNAAQLTLIVAIALYVADEVDRLERLVVPIVAMIGIQAVVVVGQLVTQESLGLVLLGEHRSIDPTISGVSVVTTADGTRWLRPYGLTDHPNLLGGVMALAALALLATRPTDRRRRVLGSIGFAVAVAILFVTFSRGAWLAFAAGLVVSIALASRLPDRATLRAWAGAGAASLAIGVVLVAVFAPVVAARTTLAGPITTETRSVDERVAIIGKAADLVIERPVLGSGLGTMPLALARRAPTLDFAYQPAHLAVLTAAAEVGLVGAAAYAVLAIGPFVAVARRGGRWTPAIVGLTGVLAAVVVIGLFDFYGWSATAGRTWSWIAIGLWAGAMRR